ncbi:polysaccharide biosynthesis/export family protein [Luteimonas kalidii]|uniref:Polysaccharide export protein n=1 Tax=Luteimonas kalidii TaxID=3042025 RepID=A0ABT6JZG6_9GAMM|nr:polysaccharide biosynthesis/export family protein [Luteimonas kalidii]MDH5835566.1 polysaccharide export protein [Luteimonas kalidii]
MASALPRPDPLALSTVQPAYLLAPGDVMLVQVFQVDDLEREVRIDNNGRVSLPLIGDVAAAGREVADLEREVAARYRDGFLKDPQVSIFVREANARRVTVSGAVNEPDIYPLVGANLTLQQALAQAGGVTSVASRRNVVVFRTVEATKMVARFDLSDIEQGLAPDPQIYGGDIVVVYRSDARLLLRTMLELTPFVMVWRAYQ